MASSSSSSIKTSNEPFIRVRLVRFTDGKHNQSLENIKLRIDTFDLQQSNILSYLILFYFSNKN